MNILILTALYPEAKYFIEKRHLKKTNRREFQEFISENGSVALAVTGTGPIRASAVTAVMLSEGPRASGYDDHGFKPRENVSRPYFGHVLSFGAAAALREELTSRLFRCHTLFDLSSGRLFYPDLLVKTDLDEASVISGSQILDMNETHNKGLEQEAASPSSAFHRYPELKRRYDLYDMESYAIAATASMFLGPHQMTFLKAASDFASPVAVTMDSLNLLLAEAAPEVNKILSALIELDPAFSGKVTGSANETGTVPAASGEEIDAFASQLFASFSMKEELTRYIRYAEAAEIDWRKLRNQLPKSIFPAPDRRHGKEVLNIFESYIE